MSPNLTGRLIETPDGRDLVIVRTFRAPIEDVWASITEPQRTARWWGSWTGEPGPGRTIHYTMAFEQDGPPAEMLIEACEPPLGTAIPTASGVGSSGSCGTPRSQETAKNPAANSPR